MKVVNKYKEKYTHYIGRGSVFGNPFRIGKDGNREEVIIKFERWLMFHHCNLIDKLIKAIYDLPEYAILGCYCKPKSCHGDVIVKIWKWLHNA